MKERWQPLQRPGPPGWRCESDGANAGTARSALTPAVAHTAPPAPERTGALRAAGRSVVQLLEGILPEHVVTDGNSCPGDLHAVRQSVRLDDPFRCADCRSAAEAATRLRVTLAGPLAVALAEAGDGAGLPDPAELGAQLRAAKRAEWLAASPWVQDVLPQQTARMLMQYWPAVEAVAETLVDRGELSAEELLETTLPALLCSPEQQPEPLHLLLQCEPEAAREVGRAGTPATRIPPVENGTFAEPAGDYQLRLEALAREVSTADPLFELYRRCGRRSSLGLTELD